MTYSVKALEDDEKVVVEYLQDAEPHLEYCAKVRRADREHGLSKRGDLRRTMSVPMIVIQKICDTYQLNFFDPEHAKEILKHLKSPEFVYFRTTDKR
jgi:hypothetical protein